MTVMADKVIASGSSNNDSKINSRGKKNKPKKPVNNDSVKMENCDSGGQSFPPGLGSKMLNMLQTVEKLEEELNPLLSKSHEEALTKLTPLDKSKLGLLEVYITCSLFWVLMKTSNETLDEQLMEDYKLEMTRLKEIQNRIAEIEARSLRPQVDREAASRFIRSGIGKRRKDAKEGEEGKSKNKMMKKEKPVDCESETFQRAWQ